MHGLPAEDAAEEEADAEDGGDDEGEYDANDEKKINYCLYACLG